MLHIACDGKLNKELKTEVLDMIFSLLLCNVKHETSIEACSSRKNFPR